MQEFIMGILTMVCLILILVVIYLLKYNKYKVDELTEEEKRIQEEQRQHYNNMLNFDAVQAYGGKK